MGWKVGRCRHVLVSELHSVEDVDPVVMNIRAATEVWMIPPK
jgi:hypothetical protein